MYTTNAAVRAMIQEGLLERAFHDSLFPTLLFRKEFQGEQWTERAQEMVKSRRGLIAPNMKTLAPKTDPSPKTYEVEQWNAMIAHYGDTVDTDTVVAGLTLADLLEADAKTAGLQAGQSINRLARNRLYNDAMYGHSVLTSTVNDVSQPIASLNGFTRAFSSTTKKFEPVSVSNPLAAYVWTGAAWSAVSITGATPATAGDEVGPGVLTLAAAFNNTARFPIVASTATKIVYSGGGHSIDDLTAADLFTLAVIRQSVANARKVNVQPCEDGYYHIHLDPIAESQLFDDSEFQLLFRGRGLDRDESDPYASFQIGTVLGCKLYRNNECPLSNTVATYAADDDNFSGELTNAAGIPIHRSVFIGRDCAIEYWKDAISSTEAGITGKLGNWNLTANGATVDVDRLQMILRSPLDRMQRVVTTSWSFMGSHVIAPDYLYAGKAFDDATFATGSSRYKRIGLILSAE